MRQILLLIIPFFMLVLISCGNKTESGQSIDSDSVYTDSLSAEAQPLAKLQTKLIKDSLKTGCWEFKAEVAYPTDGPEALVNNIREWISEVMRNSDGENDLKAYTGNKADGKSMVNYYAHAFMRSINFDDYVDLPDDVSCSSEYTIEPEFENDSIITYSYQYYVYSGGAHGGFASYGVSFRKSDGKRLGWNMIASKKALQPEIKKGLKEFFEVKTDDELTDHLQVVDEEGNFGINLNKLPLPQFEPWLDNEGLNFVYQQYEIACYAEGMPGFTIPKSRLSKYLTKEAQALIK